MKGTTDAAGVGERQERVGEVEAHLAHEGPPHLDPGGDHRVRRLQHRAEGVVGDDVAVLHPGRAVDGWSGITSICIAMPERIGRSEPG